MPFSSWYTLAFGGARTWNFDIKPIDHKIWGKGGKFRLISDLDDKTNFVLSRNRQKNLASTERAEVKHKDEALECTLPRVFSTNFRCTKCLE